MDKQLEMLKDLTDANGIAGFETAIKNKVKEYLNPLSDEIVEDNLGGVFGKKKPKRAQKRS